METWDRGMEERVWQRVLGERREEPRGEDLRPWLQTAQELAAVYRRLHRDASGRSRELLRRLLEGETANAACLKGMLALGGGQPGKGTVFAPAGEPWGKALEKCYHRTRRAMTEYTARSAGGEFGEVFRHMADREREHCAMVMELLGDR